MKLKHFLVFFICIFSSNFKSQTSLSNLDKGLVVGNLLIQGYMAIKGNGAKAATDSNAKTVESFCFKNKMDEKITVKFSGKIEEEEVKKELVIQQGEKECTYNLPKGIYTYEIALTSKEIYQKGEYKVFEEALMTVNK